MSIVGGVFADRRYARHRGRRDAGDNSASRVRRRFRPGAPPPWADLAPDRRRFTLADVRARLAELPPARRPGSRWSTAARAAAVLVPLYEANGETFVDPDQAARDDAVAQGRDRVSRRQASTRRRRRPARRPRCARRTRRSGSIRTRSRSCASSTASARSRSALHDHAVRRLPREPAGARAQPARGRARARRRRCRSCSTPSGLPRRALGHLDGSTWSTCTSTSSTTRPCGARPRGSLTSFLTHLVTGR